MDVLVREGLVEDDDLQFEEIIDAAPGRVTKVRMAGHIRCRSSVRVRVLKWMDARENDRGTVEVLSVFYQYQAWVPATAADPERSLVRYDQAHGGMPHRHAFDADGQQVAVQEFTLDAMPRLDAVIREAVALAESPGAAPAM